MTNDKPLVPKLRFPGFTDPWQQRKFDQLFNPISNNSLSRAKLNYTLGSVKSIHYGDVLIRYGAMTDCRKAKIPFITGAEAVDCRNNYLKDGDVLIADAAEDETVGKATEIVGVADVPVVAGLHIIACRPNSRMGQGYLGYYVNSPSFHESLLPLMQGTKVLSISRSTLAKTTIACPDQVEEQQIIGSFFKQLDDLIALHRRKLSHLEELKKGYFKKCFPNLEKRVPNSVSPVSLIPGNNGSWGISLDFQRVKDILKAILVKRGIP